LASLLEAGKEAHRMNIRSHHRDCGYGKNAPTDGSVRPNQGVCEKRIVRGGAWVNELSTTRSAYRYAEAEYFPNYQAGFRVVWVLKC